MSAADGWSDWPAPAKLNLFLRITGRRADGLHELQTVFRLLDWGDRVFVRPRQDGEIRRGGGDTAGIPEDQDLIVRAARALKQASGSPMGADLRAAKAIPAGGGFGGGSSDAATVLRVLDRLWGTNLGEDELARLGLGLGADVPVFVFGDNAWAEGIGEKLQSLVLPPAWYVVLTPAVSVSSARTFAHADLKRDSKMITIQSFSAAGPSQNDLEPVVCREHPEVARHLDWLRQFGRAMLTGSGACVFAGFGSAGEAHAVLARLPGSMSGFVARGLDRHPLRDLAH